MSYSIKRKYKGTSYYNCSKNNNINKCSARLIIRHDGTVIEKNQHTCISENVIRAIDVKEDMKTYLENVFSVSRISLYYPLHFGKKLKNT